MKTLTLVRGVPGNGKTTLAHKLTLPPEGESIAADKVAIPTERIAIAADEMPGLYIGGIYQNHLQKESHGWCESEVRYWMNEGISEIAVHNTFTRRIYIQNYLDLAREYGYAVHIVHSEAVILPDGSRTTNTHDVPEDILVSMHNGWENFVPLPKTGITPAQIALQLKDLKYPEAIIFDMDKTIKRPENGHAFPITPNDFEIIPEFRKWAESLADEQIDLYIISNQQGLSKGHKKVNFLYEEIDLLERELQAMGLFFLQMYFGKGKDEYLVNTSSDWASSNDLKFPSPETKGAIKGSYVKPDTGMFDAAMLGSDLKNIWIVGDAHTDNTATDWQFAQNCQKLRPDLDIRYIPIELLNIAWSMV